VHQGLLAVVLARSPTRPTERKGVAPLPLHGRRRRVSRSSDDPPRRNASSGQLCGVCIAAPTGWLPRALHSRPRPGPLWGPQKTHMQTAPFGLGLSHANRIQSGRAACLKHSSLLKVKSFRSGPWSLAWRSTLPRRSGGPDPLAQSSAVGAPGALKARLFTVRCVLLRHGSDRPPPRRAAAPRRF
jgi:hypothetical protein